MSYLRKAKFFTTEVRRKGTIYSIFVTPTPQEMDFFKSEIEKAESSGHKICSTSNKKAAVDFLSENTGIPAKVLRYRLMYYDWQKSLDMGYDPRSKSVFKEED